MAADRSSADAPLLKILDNAAAYYANGDIEKAEQEYLRILDGDHDALDVLQVFARIAAKRGDFEGANSYWDKVLELDPRHLDALIEKGVLLHSLGRLDEAVQCFAVAGSIAPENDLVLSNLAVALADSGRRHEALAEFHRVVQLRPDNIHARHQMRRLTSTIVPFWHIPC